MELTREQILEAEDVEILRVETPEWGGHVFVQTVIADESYAHSRSRLDDNGELMETNLIVDYCAFVMCNSKGERIFANDDVEKLGKKNTKTLMRVYEAGKKLNGEDLEELEKNSEATPSEDSISV